MNVGTRLNGWVPFFCAITLWGEKNFFQNFWIGVLGFLVFLWGFFIVDMEIYWIIVLTYVFALWNM